MVEGASLFIRKILWAPKETSKIYYNKVIKYRFYGNIGQPKMGHLVTSFRNGPRGTPSRALRQMITRLEAHNHLPLAKSKCKVSC